MKFDADKTVGKIEAFVFALVSERHLVIVGTGRNNILIAGIVVNADIQLAVCIIGAGCLQRQAIVITFAVGEVVGEVARDKIRQNHIGLVGNQVGRSERQIRHFLGLFNHIGIDIAAHIHLDGDIPLDSKVSAAKINMALIRIGHAGRGTAVERDGGAIVQRKIRYLIAIDRV